MSDTNRAEPMKPCPFCGGAAELDTRQGYTYAKHGQPRHGTAVAVYCTECTVQISVCREDVPDIAPEAVIEMWNRRAEVEASRLPLAGARNVTAQEDRALHNAIRRSATVVHEGMLASPAPSDAAVQQPVGQIIEGNANARTGAIWFNDLPPAGAYLYTSPLPTAPAGAREAMEKALAALIELHDRCVRVKAALDVDLPDGAPVHPQSANLTWPLSTAGLAIETIRAALAAAPGAREALSDEQIRAKFEERVNGNPADPKGCLALDEYGDYRSAFMHARFSEFKAGVTFAEAEHEITLAPIAGKGGEK